MPFTPKQARVSATDATPADSSTHQPQDEVRNRPDEQRCGEGNVEVKVVAFDHDVAGKAARGRVC